MAFSDYLDLRTAVIEAVKRPDIADVADRLTKLAEAWLNRNLRTRFQVTQVSLAVSSGVATLPDDFAEVIGFYDETSTELITKTLQDMQDDQTGLPDGNYTFQYYAKLPTLTASMTTTNWLLQEYPDLYMNAVAYEAAKYTQQPELAQVLKVLRDEGLMDAMGDDFSARYSRARVRVKGPTP